MLREVKGVRRVEGEPRRRWFTDPELDLIVWQEPGSAPSGFQLSYRSGDAWKTLTHREGGGYLHDTLDDGEGRPLRPKMAPILLADGAFEPVRIARLFDAASGEIDPIVARFVLEGIGKYPG